MSKSVSLLLVLLLLTSSHLIVSLPVKADRTLVVPDDYPTITSAIDSAAAGDTILVKEGTYEGPVNQTIVIDKTLSIVGDNAENTIIKLYPAYNISWILTASFFSYSDAITINADNVRLSSLTIFLSNPGGYITVNGDMTQIGGNNIIAGPEVGLVVRGSYCNITDNIPIGSSKFFNLGGYESSGGLINLSGSSNIIARNSFSKIHISGNSNTVSNNTCWNLRLSDANQNVVSGNKIGTTTRHSTGIYVIGNSAHNVVYANNIAGYSYDVEINSESAENNTFYRNNFINNYNNHVYIYTGNLTGTSNFWDNGYEGNYWDDYNGTDNNRDGIGDTPYIIDDKNVDNYPLMYTYDIENDGVALPPPEPFPTMLVAAALLIVAVVGVGLLVYFRKRNR